MSLWRLDSPSFWTEQLLAHWQMCLWRLDSLAFLLDHASTQDLLNSLGGDLVVSVACFVSIMIDNNDNWYIYPPDNMTIGIIFCPDNKDIC